MTTLHPSRVVALDLPDPAMSGLLEPSDTFAPRHLGPDTAEVAAMLAALGFDDLEAFTAAVLPKTIRTERSLDVAGPLTEYACIEHLRKLADANEIFRSFIGMGYADTITPPVIQRNILENPGWYTQYTPYQSEISQGRLEALLNYQTMIGDLTGLPLANASLLDEATAAAEAMVMCHNISKVKDGVFLVAESCHPQTLAVLHGRAEALGFTIRVGDVAALAAGAEPVFGALVQYPDTYGRLHDPSAAIAAVKERGGVAAVATDLLALALITPPGELGADIAIGSAQRFGVPFGGGGPHAGFMATREEYVRKMPGRLVGVSRDADGQPAYRLAVQTREQHIKRDRATSNICTAQVLLAIMAGMYAVYHGPEGIRRIAKRVHGLTTLLAEGLDGLGYDVGAGPRFDTVSVTPGGPKDAAAIRAAAEVERVNLRYFEDGAVGITLDEVATRSDVRTLLGIFGAEPSDAFARADRTPDSAALELPAELQRRSGFLTHEVFNSYRSETEMLRYITHLQSRDLSLAQSMIPLGSCTMKLNATTEMIPVTWPAFARIHPFAPAGQQRGYARLFRDLEAWLADITGFDAVSLQPNAGSQGEYAGLIVIRAYHRAHDAPERDVCIVPLSAHGTNPASAIAAGFRVVPVSCDDHGNIDLADLRAKAEKHADHLGALMVTYPSTHGVFEETIRDVCSIVHEFGGRVYLDGANLNAMVGLSRPGELGADVCHLNLHKTFCIPHGGGGPGMGPIAMTAELAPFLPGHPVLMPQNATEQAVAPVSAAPYGSASILPITWAYIAMMGPEGLRRASQLAILNANYMAKRLEGHFDVLYTGPGGFCAHEFIIDCRGFEKSAGIRIDDIAKRLMDYGFHAPTMAWPVAGTLMIEPTESESRAELDRLCDALIAIRAEIASIEAGALPADDNPLKHAPHTIAMVCGDEWNHAYPRSQAAYPLPWLRQKKFWPPVRRVDNPFGDRNLACSCPPVSAFADDAS